MEEKRHVEITLTRRSLQFPHPDLDLLWAFRLRGAAIRHFGDGAGVETIELSRIKWQETLRILNLRCWRTAKSNQLSDGLHVQDSDSVMAHGSLLPNAY